jgi:hypothetical protein
MTSLDFLRTIYLDENVPLSVRMRAAIEAAPYEHPRLAVTANLTSDDFAARLERAITRSGVKLIEVEPDK